MKKHFSKLILGLCLLSLFMLAGCKATQANGCYPAAIRWDNELYGLSIGEEVSKSELGKQLGEIKRQKEPMPLENGDANEPLVGSKLFEIKGVDTKKQIAYERDGKIYKATNLPAQSN